MNKIACNLIGLLIIGCYPQITTAAIKCWTNRDGVKECGARVPPEYAQKGHTVMDKRGFVKTQEASKSAEDILKEQKTLKKQRAAAEKQAKIDRVLRDTFAEECDLIRSRDGRLVDIHGQITVIKNLIDTYQTNLEKIEQRVAGMVQRGKPDGATEEKYFSDMEKVSKDVIIVKQQIKEQNDSIKQKHQEQKLICRRFASDTIRFRELKSIKGELMTSYECGLDLPISADGTEEMIDRCE